MAEGYDENEVAVHRLLHEVTGGVFLATPRYYELQAAVLARMVEPKSPGAKGKFDHLPLLTEEELHWYELHQIVLEANGEAKPETLRLWARIFATCRAGIAARPQGGNDDQGK